MMKYKNTINSVKSNKNAKEWINILKVWGEIENKQSVSSV